MIRFFRSLQPANLIIIPIIILVFWIRFFFSTNPVTDTNELPLWNGLSFLLGGFPSWVNFILLFALISWEAIYLSQMLNKYEVLYKNTYVPAMVFAFIISSTPALMLFHPIHVVNLFVLLIIDRAFGLYKNETAVTGLFDSGFLTGVAALFFFPAIILLPFLLTVLGVLRPFRIKEWLIILIGYFLPFFFLSVYMFWNHSLPGFISNYWNHFKHVSPAIAISKDPAVIVLGIYLGSLLILALLKLRINYRKNVIRTRNYQQIFFIYLIYGLVWLILSGEIRIIHFAFLFIPISVFCSYYFIAARRKLWLYEYILWALIGIIIWNQFSWTSPG